MLKWQTHTSAPHAESDLLGLITAKVEPDVWGRDGRGDYTSHLAKAVIGLCPSGALCNVLVGSNCQNMFVLAYMKVDRRLVKMI